MAFVSEYFDASTTAKIPADAVNLPLSDGAMADLLNLLTDTEDYTYLALKSEQTYEVVKAHKVGSMIVLDRAQEGTRAVLHPMGTCVAAVSPLTLAVMKEIACNYECCQGDCVCEPVSLVGVFGIPARIHSLTELDGFVAFQGDGPITAGVDGAPDWMTVTQIGNVVRLSGVVPQPDGPNRHNEAFVSFSVAATNCNGTSVASAPVEFEITWEE